MKSTLSEAGDKHRHYTTKHGVRVQESPKLMNSSHQTRVIMGHTRPISHSINRQINLGYTVQYLTFTGTNRRLLLQHHSHIEHTFYKRASVQFYSLINPFILLRNGKIVRRKALTTGKTLFYIFSVKTWLYITALKSALFFLFRTGTQLYVTWVATLPGLLRVKLAHSTTIVNQYYDNEYSEGVVISYEMSEMHITSYKFSEWMAITPNSI